MTPEPVRRYLDPGFVPSDWRAVAPRMRELSERPLSTVAELAAWAIEVGELHASLHEGVWLLRLAAMADTSDAAARGAVDDRMAWLLSNAEPGFAALSARLLDHVLVHALPAEFRHAVARAAVERDLFSADNAACKRRISELIGAWQKLAGTWAPPDARREHSDRSIREAGWRDESDDRARTAEQASQVLSDLTEARHQLARNAGLDTFLQYSWKQHHRPYTPEAALKLCDTIHAVVLPRLTAFRSRLRQRLGVARLRPWDRWAPPEGAPDGWPSTQESCHRILAAIDPTLARDLERLAGWGLVDLESRPNKAPGAFHVMLEDRRVPFIYMTSSGGPSDLPTLLHETGHALHGLGSRDQALLANRTLALEFAEVSSMSVELLGAGVQGPGVLAAQLVRVLEGLCIIGRNEPWRQWVCEAPRAAEAFGPVSAAFREPWDGGIDWDGLEQTRRVAYSGVGHVFFDPLYNIEYAIAQLGALQIWRRHAEDPARTMRDLRAAWALGSSVPVPELFRVAGIEMWPSEAVIGGLLDAAAPFLDLA